MIKAMIVDDKTASIEVLRWLIKQQCPEIRELVSATSAAEALPVINSYKPDLLFLDIQMPQQTGFDLLAMVKDWTFEVIFTTAYNEYAIQAIRLTALDFLLKPIQAEDLRQALDRYKLRKQYAGDRAMQYQAFVQNIASTGTPQKIALPSNDGIRYVDITNIVRLQAERNYTRFYFDDGKSYLVAKTLLEFEKTLKNCGFLRVHKSHLVQHRKVKAYDREGILELSDGSQIEVSRRKKDIVLKLFR